MRRKSTQKSLRVVTFNVGDKNHTSLQGEFKSNNGFQSRFKEIASFVFIIKTIVLQHILEVRM